MKIIRTVVLPLAVTLASLAAACAPESGSVAETDDIIAGKSASAYPEAVLVNMLSGGQIAAACSGALIAPRVVLTAGHCVHGWSAWQVIAPHTGGKSALAHDAVTYDWDVAGEAVDPSRHDVGLVILASPIDLPAYPRVATEPVAEGARVLNIGRIRDGQISNSSLFVSKPVAVVPGAELGFPYDYGAVDRIESGDSGGPGVLPGGAPHTIVAVSSGADGSIEVLARVDLVASWIAAQVKAHGAGGPGQASPGPAACAHDPCAAGKRLAKGCDPCVAAVCAGDPFCCAKHWDEQCVAEVASACGPICGGCAGIPEEGACEGDVALWCDGDLHTLDCASIGLTCAVDPESGESGCL